MCYGFEWPRVLPRVYPVRVARRPMFGYESKNIQCGETETTAIRGGCWDFSERDQLFCFCLPQMILGQKEPVPDQWNCKVLRGSRLIDSQNGGFIPVKFQYVEYGCHVDCNVTGGHGFCYQKHKTLFL